MMLKCQSCGAGLPRAAAPPIAAIPAIEATAGAAGHGAPVRIETPIPEGAVQRASPLPDLMAGIGHSGVQLAGAPAAATAAPGGTVTVPDSVRSSGSLPPHATGAATLRARVTRYASAPGVWAGQHKTVVATAAILALAVTLLFAYVYRSGEGAVMSAVVQVRAGNWSGSGFFVDVPGHKQETFVLTAYHVVDTGDPVRVVRWLGAEGATYSATYDQVDVAAMDPRTDLALLRLNHVPRAVNRPIPFSSEEAKSSPAKAYGFRASDLSERGQLDNAALDVQITNQDVRIFTDPHVPEVLQHGAAQTLIVTGPITKGNSGGPIVRYTTVPILGIPVSGQAVGVVSRGDNDNKHSEAIAISAARRLFAQLEPVTVDDTTVLAMVQRTVTEYFAADPTKYVPFTENVALSDVLYVRQAAHELARELSRGFETGSSKVDLELARLEMSDADFPAVRKEALRRQIAACATRFGSMYERSAERCEAALWRTFGQDLMKSALRFRDGMVAGEYKVSGTEVFKKEEGLYKATVTAGKVQFEIRVQLAQGKLWIRLYDGAGRLFTLGMDSESPQVFAGEWTMEPTKVTFQTSKGESFAMTLTSRMVVQVDPVESDPALARIGGKLITRVTGPGSEVCAQNGVMEIQQSIAGYASRRRAEVLAFDAKATPTACGLMVAALQGQHRLVPVGDVLLARADGGSELHVLTERPVEDSRERRSEIARLTFKKAAKQ